MVEIKMSYLTFNSSTSLKAFLKRKLSPVRKDKIEYCVMEKFPMSRILFTAEHAMFDRINVKKFGERAYVCVGDINTDVLAKLAAFSSRSAYLIPLFLRTDADASRPPDELDKGLRLFTIISHSKKQLTTYVPIHTNPEFLPHLKEYHQLIEKLNPKIIVSIHGMHVKRKFDLLFGFGENYGAIGGKKQAFRFKNEFAVYLDKVFSSLGLRSSLKIAVSTWLLTGSMNYVLTKHVIEHNRTHTNKRFGMQVEFNWRGRVKEDDMAVPTIPYQIVVQALGDFVYRWKNNIIK